MEQQSIEHNKAFASGVLEENIKKVIEHYDFDGVHFDYEYPIKLKHWNCFSDFLISLDKAMPDKLIGIAVCEWNPNIKTKAIEAVDYFELMMYDIYDEADGKHSSFEKATELSHEATMKGIPPEKMHFGLPFYARPTDHDAYWYDYKGYYDKHCCIKTAPYGGIVELMERLKAAGVKQAVISNKPDSAVRPLAEKFFGSLLEFAVGESEKVKKKPDPSGIISAAERLGLKVSDCVYVGDSEVDVQTAKNAGLDCVAVSWGFRDRAELEAAGAQMIADSVDELEGFIM